MARVSRSALPLALLACMLSTDGFAGLNNWTIQGPPGGFFRQVAVSPTDSKIMYATFSRTLHKSTDGGDTWQTIREFKDQLNAIVVADDGKVYLGVLSEGVFRSDDQGATFVQIAPGNLSGPWGVGVSGSTVYYSSGGSFFRSTDRGISWTARTNPPQSLTIVLADPTNADSIFGFNGPFLVRSVDGGTAWTQTTVSATSGNINDVVLLSSTSLVVCATDGFYVSRNAGTSWTRNTLGNPCVGIAADRNVPGTMLASVGYGHTGPLYRSLDSGDTWNFAGTIPNGPGTGLLFGPGSPASYVVVNGQGAMRSTNSGATWIEATQSPIASASQLATTSAPNSKIYAYSLGMTSGSAALYANTGVNNSWQRLNLNAAQAIRGVPFGQATLVVKPGDPETIYIGTFGTGLYRSSNGGAAWQLIGSGLAGYGINAIAFDPNDSSTMYAKVSFGGNTPPTGIYRSIDGGLNWTPRSATLRPDAYGLVMSVDRANAAHLLLGAYQGFGPSGTGGLYQSSDAGVNWTQMFVGQDVRSIVQDPVNPAIFYIAASSGLQMSSDGGATFSPNNLFSIITAQPAGSIVIDPGVPTTLYASSLDPNNSFNAAQKYSYVLRSVDRGTTWETLRKESDPGSWAISQLLLDPMTPSIINATADLHGVATFEVATDLALTITGHSGTKPLGAQSAFDIRIDNRGPYAATLVRIATSLPASLTGVSATVDRGTCNVVANNVECNVTALPNAGSANAHIIYTAPTAATIAISPSVAARERDPVSTNNSAQASVTVGEVADLGATLASSMATANPGASVAYTLIITNNGPSAATDATVTVTPGANVVLGAPPTGCTPASTTFVCGTGPLLVGGIRTFTLPATLSTSGPWTVSASVASASSASDTVATNNNAQATIGVTPPSSSSGGGGGGGGLSLELAGLLLTLEYLRRLNRRAAWRLPIREPPGDCRPRCAAW